MFGRYVSVLKVIMHSGSKDSNIYLAIFPLQVLTENARIIMYCQGLVMDLMTDLSRFKTFQIIALESIEDPNMHRKQNSGKPGSLNLDYLVKGTARELTDGLMLNLQLLNVGENRIVWSEKFKGKFDDFFQIQDDVVERIVVSLQHFVDYDLLKEIRKKPLTNLTAYECWVKGYRELKKGSLEADEKARSFFQQAMQLDPYYARACMGMSLSYFNEWSCQLWSRWEVSRNGAFEWAQKALDLDEWDHVSNTILGVIYLFNGEYQKCEHYLRKSLRINSNDAETLSRIAFAFTYLGYLNEANDFYERAKRLNPVNRYAALGSFIKFESGEFEEAIALAEEQEINRTWVDFPAYKAAACFARGDKEKAKEHWQDFLKQFSIKINDSHPADTPSALQWMMNVNPYRKETRLQPFWDFISQESDSGFKPRSEKPVPEIPNRFSQENALWMIVYDNKQVQLPNLKGLHDLARLLVQPNQPVHCTDLMGAETFEEGHEVFDQKARTEYQNRILTLQEEMKTAEDHHNTDTLATLQEEYDRILEHLAKTIGKGGKTRKVHGTVEKCRTAVTWRIRSAVKKINASHPSLGKHLSVSIKTGIFCEYTPEHDPNWIL